MKKILNRAKVTKNIRFEADLLDAVEEVRGNLTFSDFVRQAAKTQARIYKGIKAKENGTPNKDKVVNSVLQKRIEELLFEEEDVVSKTTNEVVDGKHDDDDDDEFIMINRKTKETVSNKWLINMMDKVIKDAKLKSASNKT